MQSKGEIFWASLGIEIKLTNLVTYAGKQERDICLKGTSCIPMIIHSTKSNLAFQVISIPARHFNGAQDTAKRL